MPLIKCEFDKWSRAFTAGRIVYVDTYFSSPNHLSHSLESYTHSCKYAKQNKKEFRGLSIKKTGTHRWCWKILVRWGSHNLWSYLALPVNHKFTSLFFTNTSNKEGVWELFSLPLPEIHPLLPNRSVGELHRWGKFMFFFCCFVCCFEHFCENICIPRISTAMCVCDTKESST